MFEFLKRKKSQRGYGYSYGGDYGYANGVKSIFNKRKKVLRESSIVVTNDISSINECYNTLKDNVLFLADTMPCQIIQVESSVSGEGKTTLTCNFAVSLSFNDKKVLVVDLDFRKPRVNRLFRVPSDTGLVDYLSDKIGYDELIKHTEYPNVDIIPRGSAIYNPSVLLSSEKFKAFISSLRDSYDFILLDAPPVLQISDYIHISKVSDCVLFVVAYGETKKEDVQEAASLIKKNGIPVLGTVMTFVDNKDPYTYYYGGYRKRYGYDKVEK